MSTSNSSGRSLLLAGVIAVGLSTVWFVLFAFLCGIVEGLKLSKSVEYLCVRIDGEPVIAKSQDRFQQQFLSLDRKPTEGDTYSVLHPNPVPLPQGVELTSSRNWTVRLASISDGGTPPNYWYLVHDGDPNGLAYGVGYNSVSKRVIGYIGKGGFSERLPAREDWFQVPGNAALAYAVPERSFVEPYWYIQPSIYLLSNGKLWDLNTREKTVKVLLNCPDAISISSTWHTGDSLPKPRTDGRLEQASQSTPRVLVLRTLEACLVVDPQAGTSQRYPLPTHLQNEQIAGVQLSDGRLLVISPWRTAIQTLTWIDRAGKVDAEKQVAIESSTPQMSDSSITVASALIAPAPVWQGCLLAMFVQAPPPVADEASGSTALGKAVSLGWPGFVLMLGLSLTAAWFAYRRQQQYRLPGAISWAIFVAVFGPLGWIAYRWHRTWPPLEDCPTCDLLSPRDRTACTECGTAFPPPKLTGTEVFA